MTESRLECPEWLDDAARREWRRLLRTADVESRDPEIIAAFCYTSALRRRVLEVIGTDRRKEGGPARSGRAHPLAGLEAALAAELASLAETLDIAPVEYRTQRPTRILILDEGPEDDPG